MSDKKGKTVKYLFQRYEQQPTMTLRNGYARVVLTNGVAEFETNNEGNLSELDSLLVEVFKGHPVPEEKQPVKKTTKEKEGD